MLILFLSSLQHPSDFATSSLYSSPVTEIGSPLTAEELAETTGGVEQNTIVTPSKILFGTIAYASMWPQNRPSAENSKIESGINE